LGRNAIIYNGGDNSRFMFFICHGWEGSYIVQNVMKTGEHY